MRLPRFEYFEPKTVDAACALLAQDNTRVLAGGTELLVHLKQMTKTANALVNIKKIPNLAHVEPTKDGGLSIGAATTLRTVATSPLVKDRFGILAYAAGSVGKPRLPEMGTLGGNICLDSRCFYYNQSRQWKQSLPPCYKDGGAVCHVARGSDHCNALFVADTVPALIALRAEVTVATTGNELQVPLEDFHTGDGARVNVLQPGQILTRVLIPCPTAHTGAVYLKHSLREAIDFAVVGVAVALTLDPLDGSCRGARVVLGSVTTGPLRAAEAEAALMRSRLDEPSLQEAARMAARAVRPLTHLGVSAAYKRRMIEVLTGRAVEQARQQALMS
jgi:4-hydroxybenzoyl-CoA reductase subunit beta